MNESKYIQDGEERILSFYFNNMGFGHVLMNTPLHVIEKGMNSIVPADNQEVLKKAKKIIRKLKPERIVIEDHRGNQTRKSKRIILLLNELVKHAKKIGIPISCYSREQIRTTFSNWHAETRYEIAEVIAKNIDAFENLLFEKPKYPGVEHYRSAQFDSASLGITHYYNVM